ncbi:MAG TPA: HEAT repeat domain-containing protein [Gemmatimonadaceae bacterium]|nr:HEAT repeat domain-containing protein [Gemmatimonadaceae bacterium]
MGPLKGVLMRVIGLAVAAFLFSTGGSPAAAHAYLRGDGEGFFRSSQGQGRMDVAALLTSARGAPPLICAMAAQSLRNWGWGDNSADAPSTPLSSIVSTVNYQLRQNNGDLPSEDVDRLMSALSSDDACVRELSVRILGTQNKDDRISKGFIVRLAQNDVSTREVAAFGLGLADAETAVNPLIQTLRDAAPGVRANSAWALGRIENGRALAPLVALFRDDVASVREAAVVAVGHMESTSTVPALIRVLREDNVASVRRVAAWALGENEAREAAPALAAALAGDADARVREMSAWALGSIEDRSSQTTSALTKAARSDAEDRVREVAVWALGASENRGAMDVLGDIVASDRSARVRGTAAWAIGQLDDNGVRAPAGLLKALRDDDADTRLKAAWAIGQLEDQTALPAVKAALSSEQNARVKLALIRALMRSGEHSEAAMTELLKSSDPKLREAAIRGLAGRHEPDPWPWPWPRPRPFP